MVKLSGFAVKKQTLKRKLFLYMFILAVLLLALVMAGMFLIGGFTGTKKRVYKTIDFQMEVFKRQVSSHYNGLAVMGIQLSEESAEIIEDYLAVNNMDFDGLNDSEERIIGIQEALFDPLHHKLLETDCTGAFIMLDAQVNTSVDSAEYSRTGLYLQRSTLDASDTHVLLYRGLTELGKKHGVMPHRKWRLEFRTDIFPNYNELIENAALPLTDAYRITDIMELPGTSERVMLMTVPVIGTDGTLYGLCGFEISESYFKHTFAQPSELNRVVFCLNKGENGITSAKESFGAGVLDGYYLAPNGYFVSEPFGSGLYSYKSENNSFIGMADKVNLCPGDMEFSLSVLMPRQDYDSIASKDTLRIVLLVLVFVAVAVGSCLHFSRIYLTPIKKSMDQIRQKEYCNTTTSIMEIDDLFAFLAQQDKINEEILSKIKKEKADTQASLEQIQSEQSRDRQKLERLAYSRKCEADPYDYENFRRGIKDLTESERKVFDYYLKGKRVKEIAELAGVKESTIRFHNRNIYSKLGVNSLKQLLLFATIMKQEEGDE